MDTKNFLIAIVIAVLTGSAAIFEKASLKDASPLTIFTLRSLYMTSILVVFCLVTGHLRPLLQISGRTLFFIVTPATFAVVFLILYFSILKQDLASRVIPIISVAPLITVLLSVLFLGEPFSWKRVAGAMLIAGGVALVK